MWNTKYNAPPLLSWDFAQHGFHNLLEAMRRQQDRDMLDNLAKKYQWATNPLSMLETPYQALVLTDACQTISWVNQGFTEMTGYGRSYAMGRKPAFLQGAATSQESLEKIRQSLRNHRSVTETLVNYRKNGEPYTCEVKIIPLKNNQDCITHYLAFEREVA